MGPLFSTIQGLFLTLIQFVNSLRVLKRRCKTRILSLISPLQKLIHFASIVLLAMCFTLPAFAKNVEAIKVTGNRKIEKDAIIQS